MKVDVAVIGGGVVGASAAYWLARDGRAGEVAVIEPDPTYARASTPQSAGGVRRLFSRPENVALSQFSLAFYETLQQETGLPEDVADIGFRRQGYLFLGSAEGAATLEGNYRLQESLDVPADLLDRDALAARFPSLTLDDIVIGCHSPEDGWIDPSAALRAFRVAAERAGVTFLQGRVAGLETNGHRVTKARLDDGRDIAAESFVNAAGPWCGEVARMIGATLPVEPMCRAQHYWLCSGEVEPMPLVKDESGLFFRPEGQGFVGGCPSFDIPPGFVWDVDRGFFATYFEDVVWPLLAGRVGKFEAVKLQRTWAGHYGQNLFDGNMIIGRFSRDYDNIVTACGFSGHGLMHAPAVGRALSELVLDGGYKTLDLAAFGIERVWEDRPYPELGIR